MTSRTTRQVWTADGADVIDLMDHLKSRRRTSTAIRWRRDADADLARHQDRLITAIFGGSGPQETDPALIAQGAKDIAAPGATIRTHARRELVGLRRLRSRRARRSTEVSVEARGSGDRSDQGESACAGDRRHSNQPNARTHRIQARAKDAQIVIIPNATHGSAHLDPSYTPALVTFIDAHDR